MSRPMLPDGGSSPDGTIKVAPGTWTDAAHPVQTGNNASDDIKAAVVITLNGLLDSLGTFSFVQGAVNLSKAVSDFSSNIELSLGCIAVDMEVVASGLRVAAKAFGHLDNSLVTMFHNLESQMSYYTTDTTLTTVAAATLTGLKIANPPSQHHDGGGGIGGFFSHAWHDVTSWGADIYHGTVNGLESIGVPGWIAIGAGGAVAGLFYVGVAAPAAAA